MDILFLAIVLIVAFIGYKITAQFNYVSRFALLITIVALAATALGLLHVKTVTTYTGITQAASTLSPRAVEQVCGESTAPNPSSLCYKQIEYRGFPFNVLKAEVNEQGSKEFDIVPRGATGFFINFALFLAATIIIAALIKKIVTSIRYRGYQS